MPAQVRVAIAVCEVAHCPTFRRPAVIISNLDGLVMRCILFPRF